MDLDIHSPLPERKDFRIGIIGSGFIVNDCHLVAYCKAGFNVVTIASRARANAEKVAQTHGISKVYDTPEQLLDDPSIEVLDIAVPPHAQLALIKAACARGTLKGILAQKPLGMNYREAVEAVTACEAVGITLAVNQNMRYDQSVRAAKTLLENGTIGDPVFATIDMRGIPHWMPWQQELGWVTLRIMSIHHLDCFRYWFGNPVRIYCSVRPDPRTQFPHEDGIATYILEYANGLRCVGIDDTWTGPAKEGCPSDIRIEWRIEGLNGLAIGDIGWCKEPYTHPSLLRYACKGMSGFQSPSWTESWFPDAFIGPMAQLLIALEQEEEPLISGRDNLMTMALVDAAYESAAKNAAVEISEVTGRYQRERAERVYSGKASWPINLLFGSASPPSLTDVINVIFCFNAKQVLGWALAQALDMRHRHVDETHLLLGILALRKGVTDIVLKRLEVDAEALKEQIKTELGKDEIKDVGAYPPYTIVAEKALFLALEEAKRMGRSSIMTEHMLLGLVCVDGRAAAILRTQGVELDNLRRAIHDE